jgi:type II secretory pathway pseudopilin PulG
MEFGEIAATGERGETLLELVIAIMIMSVALVALIGGLAVSILMSDIHRKESTAGVAVRDYGEAIANYVADSGSTDHYVACAIPSKYTPALVSFAVPSGYSAGTTAVMYWNGSTFSGTCTTDSGVQRLALQVSSSDNRAAESLNVVIRKPCRLADSLCN